MGWNGDWARVSGKWRVGNEDERIINEMTLMALINVLGFACELFCWVSHVEHDGQRNGSDDENREY